MQDKRLWMGVGLIHGGSSLGLAVDIDAPASDGLRSEAAEHAFVRSQRRLPASRRRNLEGDGRPGGDFLEIVAMRARATPHRGDPSKERCFEIVSGWSPMRSMAIGPLLSSNSVAALLDSGRPAPAPERHKGAGLTGRCRASLS